MAQTPLPDETPSPTSSPDPGAEATSDRVARFRQRWEHPRRTPPPSGPQGYLLLAHERNLARQREIERERLLFTARRRSMTDMLDELFNLSEDPRSDYMRLHERPRGNEACTSIVLRYKFACYLDRLRAEKRRNSAAVGDLRRSAPTLLGLARAALAQEHPDLSLVVEQTCFRHPSMPEGALAHELGVHRTTVGKRKWDALYWLKQRILEYRGDVEACS